MDNENYIIEMRNITKTFPGIIANDDVPDCVPQIEITGPSKFDEIQAKSVLLKLFNVNSLESFCKDTKHLGLVAAGAIARYIFETHSVDGVAYVNDIVEASNHFKCFDYILDTVSETMTEEYVKKLHFILKSGIMNDEHDEAVHKLLTALALHVAVVHPDTPVVFEHVVSQLVFPVPLVVFPSVVVELPHAIQLPLFALELYDPTAHAVHDDDPAKL